MSSPATDSPAGAEMDALRAALESLHGLPRDPTGPRPVDHGTEAWIDAVQHSWSAPMSNVHRQLRMPAEVWARLSGSGQSPRIGARYTRMLPPDALLRVDPSRLTAHQSASLDAVVRAWLAFCRSSALAAGTHTREDVAEDLADLEALWSDPLRALDPGDVVASGTGSNGSGEVPGAVGELVASSCLRVDGSARRAWAQFLAEIAVEERPALASVGGAVLAGLWGASVRGPRLQTEWQAAEAVGSIAAVADLASPGDVATARALLLSRTGPAVLYPKPWLRLVTWAFGRASPWPRFSAPDPELHRRLADGRYAQGDALWPDEVVQIVKAGRIPGPEPKLVRPRRRPTAGDVLADLDELVGLDEVKRQIREWVEVEKLELERRRRGGRLEPITRHVVLTGNPGTGKTTLARVIARIYRSLGILSRGDVVEVTRADLVGAYVGHTERRTRQAIERATGGILFIDEAYALASDLNGGYGQEAIDVLVAEMENRRDNLIVIAAGYPAPMQEFLTANPGLASRFPRHLSFPDLSDAALVQVFYAAAGQAGYRLDDGVSDAALAHFQAIPRGEGFGNARTARNLFDVARQRVATRFAASPDEVDVDLITAVDIPASRTRRQIDEERLLFAIESLDSLIGLEGVKAELNALVDRTRLSLELHARGLEEPAPVAPHMAFLGPPGTGKTTVARRVGEVLAALGLLESGHVVAASRSQLVGQYIGQTAPRVHGKVRDARNGVLFIDEAYSLAESDSPRDFGREALTTLVEEMENRRGEFVAILAGYTTPMQRMLGANEGLRSRVGLQVDFPSYSLDELERIAGIIAAEMNRRLGEGAAQRVARSADAMRDDPGFANARTVRNLLQAADGLLARRLAPLMGGDRISTAELLTIEAADIPEITPQEPGQWGMYL